MIESSLIGRIYTWFNIVLQTDYKGHFPENALQLLYAHVWAYLLEKVLYVEFAFLFDNVKIDLSGSQTSGTVTTVCEPSCSPEPLSKLSAVPLCSFDGGLV